MADQDSTRFTNTRWAIERAGMNISQEDADDAEKELAAAEELIAELVEASQATLTAAEFWDSDNLSPRLRAVIAKAEGSS